MLNLLERMQAVATAFRCRHMQCVLAVKLEGDASPHWHVLSSQPEDVANFLTESKTPEPSRET